MSCSLSSSNLYGCHPDMNSSSANVSTVQSFRFTLNAMPSLRKHSVERETQRHIAPIVKAASRSGAQDCDSLFSGFSDRD